MLAGAVGQPVGVDDGDDFLALFGAEEVFCFIGIRGDVEEVEEFVGIDAEGVGFGEVVLQLCVEECADVDAFAAGVPESVECCCECEPLFGAVDALEKCAACCGVAGVECGVFCLQPFSCLADGCGGFFYRGGRGGDGDVGVCGGFVECFTECDDDAFVLVGDFPAERVEGTEEEVLCDGGVVLVELAHELAVAHL